MKKLKVKFTLATNKVGSTYTKIVEIEVREDATEIEIENIIDNNYNEWLFENNRGGWEIL